ncbi:RHS repeat-associated core domain-containing protein, partial [Brevibacillus sp. HB2.2]|uniref:RHS repeat-associated core domain-containing protein n=1 Tax=Brevibacillus sp. HB2.2 TaxID=2738846 RepID=UPI0020C51161
FVYDKLSRIKEESVEGNIKQYAYDNRGNRQVYANAPGNILRSYEMKHDLFNRLQEYKDEKGTTTYTYYPGGLRATKQQTGNVTDTTNYVYLNGQVIEELTQDGRVKARNVFGNQLIWRKDYASNLEGNYYYNSHGDVVKIKAPNGNVLNTYDYDIWGNLIADKVKETISNPVMYAGEMFDKESGFYYLRARYYDPKIGRFISEDTYKGQVDNPLTLNRYTYVSNNPLKYIDPSGHQQVIQSEFSPGGNYYYYDKEGVRRIHGSKEIDWDFYVDWYGRDAYGMVEELRGTNSVKNTIAMYAGQLHRESIGMPDSINGSGTLGAFKNAGKMSKGTGIISGMPPIVQSRINISNDGWKHVVDRHFSNKNASKFTISQDELRSLLSSKDIVKSSVVKSIDSADGARYARVVTLNKSIGLDKFNDFKPTSTMTILTDKHGNLITAFPGLLK